MYKDKITKLCIPSLVMLFACGGSSETISVSYDSGIDEKPVSIDTGIDGKADNHIDSGNKTQEYSVLTQHYDNARTGVQNQETYLTPTIFTKTVVTHNTGNTIAGTVEAQPLIVKEVPFPTGTHDAVYVVDSTNTVYSFLTDASSTITLLKKRQLLQLNESVAGYGILSTPAIDKDAHRMYLVARVADPNPSLPPYNARTDNSKYLLHGLDLTDLSDVFPPVVIAGDVTVTGGTATFVPLTQLQRPGLLFNNTVDGKFVSVGFGAAPGSSGIGEGVAMQHGWVFTYNVSAAPVQSGIYLSTRIPDNINQPVCLGDPRCWGPAGIWQGAAGLAADVSGQVYLATGNAQLDADNDGSSIVQLNASGTKQQIASPKDATFLNQNDLDLGAGGPIILPYGKNNTRQFIIGKDGHAYLLGQSSGSLAIIQDFQAVDNPSTTGEVFWGDPTYFNGWVYYVGSDGNYVQALPWDITTGLFTSTTPTTISSKPEQPGGPSLSISANGNSDAVLWVIRQTEENGNIRLLAYNADPKMANQTPLFTWSDTTGNVGSRFPNVTIANGVIYLISQNSSAKLITITFN